MANETGSRKDPFTAFRFYITLKESPGAGGAGGGGSKGVMGAFSECGGLDMSMEVHEYKEGGANDRVHKFPTRAEFSNITLKRGMVIDDDLWTWHYDFVMGRGKKRDGLIVLMDEAGEPVKSWAFKRGVPKKWTAPDLNATQSSVAVESLEISHEGIELIAV